jgi:hypothetical protein
MEGLPFKEFVAVGTVIFQTRNTYTNAVKSRIRTTEDGFAYVDWRYNDITPSGFTTNNHNDLSGRDTTNSHTSNAISYDNSSSGLSSTNVKSALDELNTDLQNTIDTFNNKSYYFDFTDVNWSASGNDWVITITSATHGQSSKYMDISVYENDGSNNYKKVDVDTIIQSNLSVIFITATKFSGFLLIKGV